MIADTLLDNLAASLVRHRRRNAVLTLALVLLFSLLAVRIRFENSVESFVSPKNPDLLYYQEFKKEFGDDQMIALVVPVGDVFVRENLVEIDRISEAIEDLPQVKKVKSITTAKDTVGTADGFEVMPFMKKIPDDPVELERLKRSALANPLYRIDLVSLDGKIASLLVEAKVSSDDGRYKEILGGIQGILAQSKFKDSEHYVAGHPLVELQMTNDMWKDLGTFVPATYLCLFLFLYMCFRSLTAVMVPIVTVSVQLAFLMGLIGISGATMNAVTVGLPSLMLCVSILEAIHILSLFRAEAAKGAPSLRAIERSVRENLVPCFWTSLTTAFGFLSVAASELTPIKSFGFIASTASAAAVPICFLIMPALMEFIRPAPAAVRPGESRVFEKLYASLERLYSKRRLMIALILALFVLAGVGVLRIQSETMFLSFMRDEVPIKKATQYIEKNLGGISSFEIVVETPEENGIMEPSVLKQMERTQGYLSTLPNVHKSVSPVEFIKEMHQAMNNEDPSFYSLPDSRQLIAQYILLYSFSGRDNDLDDFVDYTYRTARIRVRIAEMSSREVRELLSKIEKFIAGNFDKHLKVRVTSHAVIQAKMTDALVEGQVKGFGVEILIMFLIFLATNRWSLPVAVLGLIPNVIPILGSLALMGYAGITMNPGTAMTCCIAFGLVVDDTIHFLEHVRPILRSEPDPHKAVRELFGKLGSAAIYSAGILAAGFGILVFGQSFLTVDFGLVCAFTILAAVFCDLLILPFLIIHVRVFRKGLV